MGNFTNYMDQIKAEEDLKEKTKAFIGSTCCQDLMNCPTAPLNKKKLRWNFARKYMTAAASFVFFLFMLGSGYALYYNPATYLSLDINPSVELGMNVFNRIVQTEGFNEDGRGLLQASKINGLPVETGLGILIANAAVQGYIAEDGSTVIALTCQSNNSGAAWQLQDKTRVRVRKILAERALTAIVYTDVTNTQQRRMVRSTGLSPGRFRLLAVLEALEKNMGTAQYRNATMADIICRANELLKRLPTDAIQTAAEAKTYAMIMTAAQEIQEQKEHMVLDQAQGLEQIENRIQTGVQTQTDNLHDAADLEVQTGTQADTQAGKQAQTRTRTDNSSEILRENQTQNQNKTGTKADDPTENMNPAETGNETQAQTGNQDGMQTGNQDGTMTSTETQQQNQTQIQNGMTGEIQENNQTGAGTPTETPAQTGTQSENQMGAKTDTQSPVQAPEQTAPDNKGGME